MALKLAEMNAFLQRRQAEDEHLQQEIQDTFKEINKLVKPILKIILCLLSL